MTQDRIVDKLNSLDCDYMRLSNVLRFNPWISKGYQKKLLERRDGVRREIGVYTDCWIEIELENME